jgi:hypothetical protein
MTQYHNLACTIRRYASASGPIGFRFWTNGIRRTSAQART